MLIKSLIIGLYAGLAGVDGNNTQFKIGRPLVAGMIVGFFLGDVKKGLTVGTILEMLGLGMVGLGGVSPPNFIVAGILGAAFAIEAGISAKLAVCLALPFAMIVQWGMSRVYKGYSWFADKIDEYAGRGEINKVELLHISGIIPLFIFYGVVVFFSFYLGINVIEKWIKLLPQFLVEGLEMAGGLMPAVGFALLLKAMLKRKYIFLVLLGFTFVAFFRFPLIAVVLIVTAFVMDKFLKERSNKSENTEQIMTFNLNSKKITKKELYKIACRSLFLQASFNYKKMQATGWLYSILPALRRIYKERQNDLKESLKAHLETFNSHPFLTPLILGIVVAMEEEHQNVDAIKKVKTTLMSAFGGIGDSVIWMMIFPICAGLGISLATQGNVWGPVLFLALFNVIHFTLVFGGINYGYKKNLGLLTNLKNYTKVISSVSSVVGLVIVGALIALYVNVSLPVIVGLVKTRSIYAVLDNFLEIIFMLFAYCLFRKGLSPNKVIGIAVLFGIVLKYLKIL